MKRLTTTMAVLLAACVAMPTAAQAQNDNRNRNSETRDRAAAEREDRDRALQESREREAYLRRQMDRQRRQQAEARNQRERASSQQRFSATGEILRMKKVDLRGRDMQHAVALLRNQRNQKGVVDLGPVEQLRELRLKQGDRISVVGKGVRVGDRSVLMATRVEANNNAVNVDRVEEKRRAVRRAVERSDVRREQSREDMRREQRRPSRENARERDRRSDVVRGEVERTKRVRVVPLKRDHLVALVRTEQGAAKIVDLGPVENLRTIQFAQGDTLIAAGDTVAIGDRDVLMARRLEAGGQQQEIQRNRDEMPVTTQRSDRERDSRERETRDRNNRERDYR